MKAAADSLTPAARHRSGAAPGWTLVAFAIALPAALALLVVVVAVLRPDTELLRHLVAFVLPRVAFNTLLLVLGVAVLATLIGVSLAWLTAIYDFPGRRLFTWALLLPMAMPGYVMAFVAIGVLDYTGPFQGLLRDTLGIDTSLVPIRSRGGIVVVMSLALYPYVYLLARNGFLTQGRQALEVAQSLGYNRRQGFFRVALPLARPWIAGGMMLVVMETLADFGTVSVFNYDTFTTAIYTAWFSLYSIDSALQLAFFLLLLVGVALYGERRLRGRAGFTARLVPVSAPLRLRGTKAWSATGFASLVLALGFVLPTLQLSIWSAAHLVENLDTRFFGYAARSVAVAALASASIVATALLLVYALRLAPSRPGRAAARLATLGYAVPGTVLAVAIYTQLAHLNTALNTALQALGTASPALFLQGTLLAMLLAYLVRFLAVAQQSIDAAMQRVTPQLDEASRSLGVSGWRMLRRVHMPLLRGGLLTGLVLVFVDVMKEMPITLMTRPFGWDTLAVRVYEMTAEGQWQQAALPALAIVAAGLLPVILITRASANAIATR